MPTVQRMIHCTHCGQRTLHVGEKPTHWLHAVLTVLTVGLWIIPWSWVTLAAGQPRCSVCGKAVGRFQMKR